MLYDEITQQPKPKVFLDMDGVLADFFGAWAEQMGGEPGDTWEYIKTLSADQRETSIHKLAGDPENIERFFANLQPLNGGKQIVHLLQQSNTPFTILSAPMQGHHAAASIRGKRIWLQSHNLGSVPAIFTRDKHLYATQPNGSPNLLIDDYGKNTRAWQAHGGTAIKHDDHTTAHTLQELKKYL